MQWLEVLCNIATFSRFCEAREENLNITGRFRKSNWVTFTIVNIPELEKGNGELYLMLGNLYITMVYLRLS